MQSKILFERQLKNSIKKIIKEILLENEQGSYKTFLDNAATLMGQYGASIKEVLDEIRNFLDPIEKIRVETFNTFEKEENAYKELSPLLKTKKEESQKKIDILKSRARNLSFYMDKISKIKSEIYDNFFAESRSGLVHINNINTYLEKNPKISKETFTPGNVLYDSIRPFVTQKKRFDQYLQGLPNKIKSINNTYNFLIKDLGVENLPKFDESKLLNQVQNITNIVDEICAILQRIVSEYNINIFTDIEISDKEQTYRWENKKIRRGRFVK